MSRNLDHNKVKLIDGVSVAAEATTYSVWYPIDGWYDLRLWTSATVASGTANYTITARISDEHYQVLRDAETTVGDLTTTRYKAYTVVSGSSATIKTEYSSDDVADFLRPGSSIQLVLAQAAGAGTGVFTVTLGAFG